MSDDLDRMLTNMGWQRAWLDVEFPKMLAQWEEAEILDFLTRPKTMKNLDLRTMNLLRRALSERLRAMGAKPQRKRVEPLATHEQAVAAYKEHGNERDAAEALGVSKTQFRRYLGKDK